MAIDREYELFLNKPLAELIHDWMAAVTQNSPELKTIREVMQIRTKGLLENLSGMSRVVDHRIVEKFMMENNLSAVLFELVAYVRSLNVPFDATSPELRELIGFAGLVDCSTRMLPKELTYLSVSDVGARFSHTRRLNRPENLLTILGELVFYHNDQHEGMLKGAIQQQTTQRLLQLHRPLEQNDLEAIFNQLAEAIYPDHPQNMEFIRTYENPIDQYVELICLKKTIGSVPYKFRLLRELLPNKTTTDRRYAIHKLLSVVNNFDHILSYPIQPEPVLARSAAQIYAVYIAIHPNQDFNNSLSKILINVLLEKNGFQAINWYEVKKNSHMVQRMFDGYGQWTMQDILPLENVFIDLLRQFSRKKQVELSRQ